MRPLCRPSLCMMDLSSRPFRTFPLYWAVISIYMVIGGVWNGYHDRLRSFFSGPRCMSLRPEQEY